MLNTKDIPEAVKSVLIKENAKYPKLWLFIKLLWIH